MRILGLDISSTTIGIGLVEEKNKKFSLIHQEYYKPSKGNLFESLYNVRIKIQNILTEHKPDEVVLEDIAEFFPNKSTSKTIIKLAVYNRTVGLVVYEYLKKEPELMNVNTVRAIIKPKGYRGKLAKEDVPEVVAAVLKTKFPWVLKKNDKIAVESYDVADAIAVALAFGALRLVKK